MLLELKVSDFAIIDSIHICFEPGLNILSGETGAGKSVLLKSLALLMGEKASAETVRKGAEQAVIEGFFDLSQRSDTLQALKDMEIDISEEQLVVRRVISSHGKSRVYLNGSLMPLTSLRDVVSPLIEVAGPAAPLIEMTGQHESRHLLSTAYHLTLLDQSGGLLKERFEVSQLHSQWRRLQQEIQQLENEGRDRAQRLDFLQFQSQEIRAMNLVAGEEKELEERLLRLRNASKLSEYVNLAEASLYGDEDSALVRIHRILQKGQELAAVDSRLQQKLESLQQAKTLLEETVYDLREYASHIEDDAEALQSSEERLSQLRALQRKYGHEVSEILQSLAEMDKVIERLQNSDEHLNALHKALSEAELALKQKAESLHKKRRDQAKKLEKRVNEQLSDLNMKGVQFHVHVEKTEALNANGLSDVEFMIQNSQADEARSLAKFASGGELSRILLSLKFVAGDGERPRTHLFDEVDTGVSGPTAEKVGRKLMAISHGQQVICVTHLPQVAVFADTHYRLQKSPDKTGVHMKIERLNQQLRTEEIARLISGETITSSSLQHAKQLLKSV